jgi:hypothetical protein
MVLDEYRGGVLYRSGACLSDFEGTMDTTLNLSFPRSKRLVESSSAIENLGDEWRNSSDGCNGSIIKGVALGSLR